MTTKLSYRDILDRTFDDKELVEFLTEFLDSHKNFGAFRMKALPSHVLVTLIDRIKTLEEGILSYYPQASTHKIPATEPDTFEEENGPETLEE